MKKIFSLLSIVGLSLLVIASCGPNKLGEKSEYGDNVNNLENVSLQLNQKKYQSEGDKFELIVINDSEEEISYGAPFILEYFKEDTWYEVEPDHEIGFILILYTLPPEDQAAEELNLDAYEPLEPGHYRIVRHIGDEALTVEFEVPKK